MKNEKTNKDKHSISLNYTLQTLIKWHAQELLAKQLI